MNLVAESVHKKGLKKKHIKIILSKNHRRTQNILSMFRQAQHEKGCQPEALEGDKLIKQ